jgi:uncharacterized membrane protein
LLFVILKWVHVLAAITAVGLNMSYGIWLARAARNPEHLPFTLRGIKILDDRMANPAYGLLLITGLAMVFTTPIPFMTPWLLTGFILFIAVALIGILGYSRTLKKQIALVEAGSAGTAEYQAVSSLARLQGILLAALVIAITFLMVVKPPLWAAA